VGPSPAVAARLGHGGHQGGGRRRARGGGGTGSGIHRRRFISRGGGGLRDRTLSDNVQMTTRHHGRDDVERAGIETDMRVEPRPPPSPAAQTASSARGGGGRQRGAGINRRHPHPQTKFPTTPTAEWHWHRGAPAGGAVEGPAFDLLQVLRPQGGAPAAAQTPRPASHGDGERRGKMLAVALFALVRGGRRGDAPWFAPGTARAQPPSLRGTRPWQGLDGVPQLEVRLRDPQPQGALRHPRRR